MEDQQHLAMRQQPFSQKQRYEQKHTLKRIFLIIKPLQPSCCSPESMVFIKCVIESYFIFSCTMFRLYCISVLIAHSFLDLNALLSLFLLDWSLCTKLREWPMAQQLDQGSSSNSSRDQDMWTSAPRFSSTSNSLVRLHFVKTSINYKVLPNVNYKFKHPIWL